MQNDQGTINRRWAMGKGVCLIGNDPGANSARWQWATVGNLLGAKPQKNEQLLHGGCIKIGCLVVAPANICCGRRTITEGCVAVMRPHLAIRMRGLPGVAAVPACRGRCPVAREIHSVRKRPWLAPGHCARARVRRAMKVLATKRGGVQRVGWSGMRGIPALGPCKVSVRLVSCCRDHTMECLWDTRKEFEEFNARPPGVIVACPCCLSRRAPMGMSRKRQPIMICLGELGG